MRFARSLFENAWLGLAYFGAAAVMLSLTRFGGSVAFLWIAASLLISVLAARSRRLWGAPLLVCAVASVLATGLFGYGWALAPAFATANLVEAYVGARLLRNRRYAKDELGSVDWIVNFVVSVGIIAPAASALIVVPALAAAGKPAMSATFHFFAGHALGSITFIPILSLIVRGRMKEALRLNSRYRAAEAIVLFGLVALTTVAVFDQTVFPLLFLPMLPIILATFRLGQGGAAVSVVILALIGGGYTMAGHGPVALMNAPLGEAMQFFQFFLAATVLTVLPVAADLRQRARLHRELRLSEERYRLLSDHSTDIVMHLEADGRIRFVSPSIEQLGGYSPDDLRGRNANILIAPDHIERVRDAHLTTIASKGATHSFDYEAIMRNGDRRWFETHTRAVIDDEGDVDGVICFVRDVSARKATEQQLTEAAFTDPLTGMPNRRAFRAAAQQLVAAPASDAQHCIAVFDIDHFKQVNDRFGHDAGDAVLMTFGEVARATLRGSGLIARIGGEEFAALMPNTSIEQALAICERMRSEIADAATEVGRQYIRVTISGGVATLGQDGIDLAYKNADAALYRAKEGGRDQLYLAA
jgi:diguanylate cyclase (GGDEF)-like protein/PAS domain S-box-containing protein